jgi:hypothetical protein
MVLSIEYIPNRLVSEEFDDEEEVEGPRERVCGDGATLSKT